MLKDFLAFGGSEILNNSRAYAYARQFGIGVRCTPCETLPDALDQHGYTTPASDDAPWYDPARPESARVLGFMTLDVTGFTKNPISRSTTDLVADGALVGTLRRTGRETLWSVLVIALDDAAMSYAYEWLAVMLRGSMCGTATGGCGGDEMCVYSSCPTSAPKPGLEVGEDELRHLFDTALLGGPDEQERWTMPASTRGKCGGEAATGSAVLSKAEFTLISGKPWIYHESVPRTETWTNLATGALVKNFDPNAVYNLCPTSKSCLTDPSCKQPAMPPVPPVPIDPCFPTSKFDARRTLLDVNAVYMPETLEAVPVLEVFTGTTALRRLTARFHVNPAGLPCSAVSDPCAACFDISIPYLPAGASLTVDGRTQRAVVDCSGGLGQSTATPVLYGPQGRAFQWPVFECPTGLCIELLAQADTVTPTTRARVQITPRGDAG